MTITKHILIEGKKSINGLEVSHNLGLMNWYHAKIACKNLGKGWRLPTKEELNMVYENIGEISGVINSYYWSSSEYDNYDAWAQNFSNGFQGNYGKGFYNFVRAVRSS